jgi:hypothetical protein
MGRRQGAGLSGAVKTESVKLCSAGKKASCRSPWGPLAGEGREQAVKIVSHGCLEFYDLDRRVGVTLVPFEKITSHPRAGDDTWLSGETHEGVNYAVGWYNVETFSFTLQEAPEDRSL